MTFITGSANSIPELRTALLNGLVANGYTLDGDVIYKGDVFVEVTIPTGESEGENRMVRLLGGTSQAGGVLSDVAPKAVRFGFNTGTTWAFPVAYNLHILTNPDEIYFVIRRQTNDYQHAAFGGGNVAGLPGTGQWVTASRGDSELEFDTLGIRSTGNERAENNQTRNAFAPFWGEGAYVNTVLHHGLDGVGWSAASGNFGGVGNLNAATTAFPHIDRSPNAWNGEAPLLPIQPGFLRASDHVSIVGDLAHARYLRIDNYNPEEIIDLNPDFWMVYPFKSKNTAERDGGGNLNHTGTFGWAIRYDGPV